MVLDVVELSPEAGTCTAVALLSTTIAVIMVESATDIEVDELELGLDVRDSGSGEAGVSEGPVLELVYV